MQRSLFALLIAGLFAGLSACRKDPDPAPIPAGTGPRVFVVCEGSYGSGNSALTVYYPDSGLVIPDLYYQVNGHSLGDVFQSMIHTTPDQFWLCVNNSDRISVIGNGSMAEIASIQIPKPRYAVQVSDTKAYVSTLFSKNVYVINPRTNAVTKTISMPFRNPEGMALAGNKLWVATWDTAAAGVYAIDTATDAISAPALIAGNAPQEIIQDAEGMLWVLSGNDAQGAESKLTRLNPATGAILRSYSFGTADALKPTFNKAGDTLYFIEVSYTGGNTNNGVYRMGIHDAALPTQPFVAAQGLQYFWGVGVHPRSGNIYVADPKGFTQKGMVRIYKPNGSIVDSFATGVGPGHFFFEE
jgi:YVTN family beta-propeller protein